MGTTLEIILAGKDKSIKAFNSAQRSMTNLAKKAASLQGALLGLAGAAGMGALVKSSFSAVDKLAKTSDELGVSTEALAGLRHAADLTGVSQEKLDSSLERMVKRLGEAKQGTGAAKKELDLLGLSADKLVKLKADQAFKIISDRVAGLKTQSEKAAAAAAIFGREGVALVNTMKLGAKGLDAAAEEAKKFGLAVSRVDAKRIERANDAFTRAAGAIKGVGNRIAVSLAPGVERLATGFANWVAQNDKLISQDLASVIRGIGKAFEFTGKAFKRYMDFATGNDLYKSQRQLLEASLKKYQAARAEIERSNAPQKAGMLEGFDRTIKLITDKIAMLSAESKKAADNSYSLSQMMEDVGKSADAAAHPIDSLAHDVASLKHAAALSIEAAKGSVSDLDKQAAAAEKYLKENTKHTADALVDTTKASGDVINIIAQQSDKVISGVRQRARALRDELQFSVAFWDKKIAEFNQQRAYDEAANVGGYSIAGQQTVEGWRKYLTTQRERAAYVQANTTNSNNTTNNKYQISFNTAFLNADKTSMKKAADMIQAELKRRETRTR